MLEELQKLYVWAWNRGRGNGEGKDSWEATLILQVLSKNQLRLLTRHSPRSVYVCYLMLVFVIDFTRVCERGRERVEQQQQKS